MTTRHIDKGLDKASITKCKAVFLRPSLHSNEKLTKYFREKRFGNNQMLLYGKVYLRKTSKTYILKATTVFIFYLKPKDLNKGYSRFLE